MMTDLSQESATTITNKVANSGLITIDLENYYDTSERVQYDLSQNLYEGFILKEKDFRTFLKQHDWAQYEGKNVAVHCSADAIVPMWAYMLLAVHLSPYAKRIVYGTLTDLESALFEEAISRIEFSQYTDAKVVIKGCSKYPVPASAYLKLTSRLFPYASSIMFGEPCSTVPIYKKPKK